MRIARCEPALQADLIAATLRGETTREIRSRIAESKGPSKGKRGRGSTTAPTKLIFAFSETCEDCTATVRGPEGESTREHMRTAVEKLLKQLWPMPRQTTPNEMGQAPLFTGCFSSSPKGLDNCSDAC